MVPDANTTTGFIFYTTMVYGFLVFSAWLVNPTLEDEYKEEM